jgi:hypothetical protein
VKRNGRDQGGQGDEKDESGRKIHPGKIGLDKKENRGMQQISSITIFARKA